MKTLTVDLGDRSYPIYIGEGVLGEAGSLLVQARLTGALAVVTDSNVGPLYAERLSRVLGDTPLICTLPAGEEHKRLAQIEWLCGQFLEAGLDRSSAVIALGGGVVGDVAGFAAASFMRGIRFAQIPTTIVAQVDSSVGGKTGVNHPAGKNTIGAFHQPEAVVIDMTLLQTLPGREARAGLAEAIKHGVIADAELFAFMEEHAGAIVAGDPRALERPILRSCEIKSAVVAEDEREHGLRAILNYGHTFGHGIEAVTEYKRFLHGEAVALGMHAAGVMAEALGMVDAAFVERQRACLTAYGLPVTWRDLPVAETLALMRHDKKARGGTMKFIVPDRLGHVVQRTDIAESDVRNALEALRA
ncbi:MAG: 3-dehydroquinate synthase [Nitrospiraceae bacterium]|nr:3-dehydroquinate synthase [Nitrospiraceae bacterium]